MLVNLIHSLFWLSQDFVGKAKRAPVGMGIDLSSGCKNLLEPVGFSLVHTHTPPPRQKQGRALFVCSFCPPGLIKLRKKLSRRS